MLRTYSKKARMEVCPVTDSFDSVVSRDKAKSRTVDTPNVSQDLQKKPPNRSSDSGTSEYTLTWTYTYETDVNTNDNNLPPIEVPRRDSHEVSDIVHPTQDMFSPILPQIQEEAADKVNRWLDHSADQSPSIEEKGIGPRHHRMNSTLMDNSQAQNAEDAMKHLQGISTIYEGEDVLFDDSPLGSSQHKLKRLKQTLETTPPVHKSTAKPKAPTKTGSQQRKRKGSLQPKNPDMIFGLEAQENQIPIPMKYAKEIPLGRVTRQPPGKLKLHTESLNKLERIDEMEDSDGQLSPRWTPLHHPKKTVAKTSTPAKHGPTTCDDLHMFSVDLSSVNPSNETGVELQIHQSRFVNSSEVVHDSDYLTPKLMKNEADEQQNGKTQNSSKSLSPDKKPSTDRAKNKSMPLPVESNGSKKLKTRRSISPKRKEETTNSRSNGSQFSSPGINVAGRGTSFVQHPQPRKREAKTSTPAKRWASASGDRHMFSVDLSSVNPSNETGVELQIHQSRIVNSSEVVHDSDYLTPELMRNQTAPTQKSQIRSTKAMVLTGTSIEDNETASIEVELKSRNTHNFDHLPIKLMAPDKKSSEGNSTSSEKNESIRLETNESKKIAPTTSMNPRKKQEMSALTQRSSRRINAASAKSRLAVGKAMNTVKCHRTGQFARVRLNNSSQPSKYSRELRDAKVQQKRQQSQCKSTNNEASQGLMVSQKGEPEAGEYQEKRPQPLRKGRKSPQPQGAIQSVRDLEMEAAEVSSPEIQRCMSISNNMAKTHSLIETVGSNTSSKADITKHSSSGRKSVTFAEDSRSFQRKPFCDISNVPVCCLSLFDENRPMKKQRSRPMKGDYKSLCSNVPIDCLALFDE